MDGAFGAPRRVALYLPAWLMPSLLLAGLIVAVTGASWDAGLLFALPLTLVYACACGFSAYYLCRGFPLAQKSLRTVLTVFGFSALCAAALWTAAGVVWAELWRAVAPGWNSVEVSRSFAALMFGFGVLLYIMFAVAHYLALEFERARRAETRELEMKLLARDAELRMLRSQIDPHFLFNSLNSISALTSIDSNGARSMTLRLAEFYRRTLGFEAHRKVALEAEIDLVRQFLAIEQVRFGPRLAFEHDIGEEAGRCMLPPMILQPLVENAVKHGIGQLIDGGLVRVWAERAGSILRIRVENDADDAGQAAGQGIGLANVRQRLAMAYAHEASVHCSRDGGKFRVDIALPAQTEED